MAELKDKRLNLATKAVDAGTRLLDAVADLQQLSLRYTAISSPFQDSDFVATDLKHLDAYTIGALLANVTAAIGTTVTDAANGNFNLNILEKVRR